MKESNKFGGGGRFQKTVEAIKRANGYTDTRAKAIAAAEGIAKYGQDKMRKMAQASKRRAAKKGE